MAREMAAQLAIGRFPTPERCGRGREPGVHAEVVDQPVDRKAVQHGAVGFFGIFEDASGQPDSVHGKRANLVLDEPSRERQRFGKRCDVRTRTPPAVFRRGRVRNILPNILRDQIGRCAATGGQRGKLAPAERRSRFPTHTVLHIFLLSLIALAFRPIRSYCALHPGAARQHAECVRGDALAASLSLRAMALAMSACACADEIRSIGPEPSRWRMNRKASRGIITCAKTLGRKLLPEPLHSVSWNTWSRL